MLKAFTFTTTAVAATNLFMLEDSKPDLDINMQPVIGILTQTLEDEMKTDPAFAGYTSYIMSSYVKYIEAQGARVVPIVWGEDDLVTK